VLNSNIFFANKVNHFYPLIKLTSKVGNEFLIEGKLISITN